MNNDRFKCRYWHKPTNRYLRSAKLVYNDGTYTQVGTKQTSEWCCQSYIVAEYNTFDIVAEQCTGLTDKNGKLIFEGDIVTDSERVGYITWFDERGAWGVTGFLFGRNPDRLEIIGNIHQNKELLK